MMRVTIDKLVLIIVVMIVPPITSYGQEITTRYSTIIYNDEEQITKFNEMSLRGLSRQISSEKFNTSHDEIIEKVDTVVQKVETMLHVYLPDLKFQIVLLSSSDEVQSVYEAKYGISVQYIAFYSPRDKTVFISVDDINLHIFAHELTHVIIDRYFYKPPPVAIHEAIAEYVDLHIDD